MDSVELISEFSKRYSAACSLSNKEEGTSVKFCVLNESLIDFQKPARIKGCSS
jgi:hypothetical protein